MVEKTPTSSGDVYHPYPRSSSVLKRGAGRGQMTVPGPFGGQRWTAGDRRSLIPRRGGEAGPGCHPRPHGPVRGPTQWSGRPVDRAPPNSCRAVRAGATV